MASEGLLEGLAGLLGGLESGLTKAQARKASKREEKRLQEEDDYRRRTQEGERRIALQQYEDEQKRTALLDAMARNRDELNQKQTEQEMQLAQERADREKAQLIDIPVTVGGKEYTLPKAVADELRSRAALSDIEKSDRVSITDPSGRAFQVDPQDAARYYTDTEEAKQRRKQAAKEQLTNLYKDMLSQPGADPNQVMQAVGGFAERFYAEELGLDNSGSTPNPMSPAPPTEEEAAGGTNRLGGPGRLMGAVTKRLMSQGPSAAGGMLTDLVAEIAANAGERMNPSSPQDLITLERDRGNAWALGGPEPPPGKYFNVDPSRPYGRYVPPPIQQQFPGIIHSDEHASQFLAGRLKLNRGL